jgi:hypothetical protein
MLSQLRKCSYGIANHKRQVPVMQDLAHFKALTELLTFFVEFAGTVLFTS